MMPSSSTIHEVDVATAGAARRQCAGCQRGGGFLSLRRVSRFLVLTNGGGHIAPPRPPAWVSRPYTAAALSITGVRRPRCDNFTCSSPNLFDDHYLVNHVPLDPARRASWHEALQVAWEQRRFSDVSRANQSRRESLQTHAKATVRWHAMTECLEVASQ